MAKDVPRRLPSKAELEAIAESIVRLTGCHKSVAKTAVLCRECC
jgi:hypothetical protein